MKMPYRTYMGSFSPRASRRLSLASCVASCGSIMEVGSPDRLTIRNTTSVTISRTGIT